ncbi:hypothetical protein HanRHA438_Chr07g0313531 [Helianthus annuus]|nr:hypothetical protein HanRHA438_Chr07g0313531 [Helianthus annuus]
MNLFRGRIIVQNNKSTNIEKWLLKQRSSDSQVSMRKQNVQIVGIQTESATLINMATSQLMTKR